MVAASAIANEVLMDEEDEMASVSKKPGRTKQATGMIAIQSPNEPEEREVTAGIAANVEFGESTVDTAVKSPPNRKRKSSAKQCIAEGTDRQESGGERKGKKRRMKVYEEPEYIIPDVEKKKTTFKGRLGE